MRMLPGQTLEGFSLPLVGGGTFDLATADKPRSFRMLVAYRGLHCPLCKMQLGELHGRLIELAQRGMSVLAFSMNDEAAATRTKTDWGLDALDLAYGLSADQARTLGLYLSAGRPGSPEPALFSEPGIFLLKPDDTLYFAATQNMPFARPPLDQILHGVDFVSEHDYPACGTLA
jgi:peroxiredoxin